MAIKTVVRAAVTVSVAVALSGTVDMERTGTTWTMSDLPRAMLKSIDNEASSCGKEFPGYYEFPGLKWSSSWNKTMDTWNTTACARTCDENKHCIAFTAKKPRHGKMLCNFYKALLKEPDHRAMSYMRCVTGFDCQDGFQFAHAGTWKGGTPMENLEMESKAECRSACNDNRGCVGFSYRVTRTGESFCSHFENDDNKDGPSRDMRANTYSKCGQFEAPPELDEPNQTTDSADEESEEPARESKDEQSEAPASADEDSA